MNEFKESKKELDPEEMSADVVFEDEAVSEQVVNHMEEVETGCDSEDAEKAATAEATEMTTENVTESPTEDTVENVSEPVLDAEVDETIEISMDEYREILEEHFQNIRSLIKYTKTKDETIQKLSNELQKYREDYCAKIFRSIATLIISFREDCRRSLSDIDLYDITSEKAKKFLAYLKDAIEELLSSSGCEKHEGMWLFNGRPLTMNERQEIKFPQVFVADEATDETDATITGNNIKDLLTDAEAKIRLVLADNEKLDKCLNDYCTLASTIENDIVILGVYPPVRKLVLLCEKAGQRIDAYLNERDEENTVNHYREILTFLISQLEDVLLSGGVRIDTTLSEQFDAKKNRLVKVVITNDSKMDRIIAKQHTECYTLNGVVLYPAKVDVYKYKAQENDLE